MSLRKLRWMAVSAVVSLAVSCAPSCPEGQTAADVCTQCGASGQCAQMDSVCTTTCTSQVDCSLPYQCIAGLCQPVPCM
jgi:hypothetical protein